VRRDVLLRAGPRLILIRGRGDSETEIPLGRDPEAAAEATEHLAETLSTLSRREGGLGRGESPLEVCEPSLLAAPASGGAPRLLTPVERRAFREASWPPLSAFDREFYLALARRRVAEALSSPVEVLVSLSREEERVERGLLRERGATEQFLTGDLPSLEAFRARWSVLRQTLTEHHDRLVEELEARARAVAPNLSTVVGPRVAARLVARAGGLGALARMSSSRLQLLGSRRRPGPGRSPRFGVLYRAEGMESVPPDRQGAYARSLAALAVIAARMDLAPRPGAVSSLMRRRSRRVTSLNAGRR